MRQLTVFNFITLNGFFKGPQEDVRWHRHGAEESQLSEEGLAQDSILVFGRKTYDMMVSFWPTPMAEDRHLQNDEGCRLEQHKGGEQECA
jgi:dihydrofolate reductase